MTPHQQQTHDDGSISVRRYRGGCWSIAKWWEGCDAENFVELQNRYIENWHQESVRNYVGRGEAA